MFHFSALFIANSLLDEDKFHQGNFLLKDSQMCESASNIASAMWCSIRIHSHKRLRTTDAREDQSPNPRLAGEGGGSQAAMSTTQDSGESFLYLGKSRPVKVCGSENSRSGNSFTTRVWSGQTDKGSCSVMEM